MTFTQDPFWQRAIDYLKQQNDFETASILASLRHAGAIVEIINDKPRIKWAHCVLPMPHSQVKRDYLMPHREAIAAALEHARANHPLELVA